MQATTVTVNSDVSHRFPVGVTIQNEDRSWSGEITSVELVDGGPLVDPAPCYGFDGDPAERGDAVAHYDRARFTVVSRFNVGDRITWGTGASQYTVAEITDEGRYGLVDGVPTDTGQPIETFNPSPFPIKSIDSDGWIVEPETRFNVGDTIISTEYLGWEGHVTSIETVRGNPCYGFGGRPARWADTVDYYNQDHSSKKVVPAFNVGDRITLGHRFADYTVEAIEDGEYVLVDGTVRRSGLPHVISTETISVEEVDNDDPLLVERYEDDFDDEWLDDTFEDRVVLTVTDDEARFIYDRVGSLGIDAAKREYGIDSLDLYRRIRTARQAVQS